MSIEIIEEKRNVGVKKMGKENLIIRITVGQEPQGPSMVCVSIYGP